MISCLELPQINIDILVCLLITTDLSVDDDGRGDGAGVVLAAAGGGLVPAGAGRRRGDVLARRPEHAAAALARAARPRAVTQRVRGEGEDDADRGLGLLGQQDLRGAGLVQLIVPERGQLAAAEGLVLLAGGLGAARDEPGGVLGCGRRLGAGHGGQEGECGEGGEGRHRDQQGGAGRAWSSF